MQLNCDCHIHTVYGKHTDSDMTVANILAAATEAGLRRVVILEHHPEIGPSRPSIEEWRQGRTNREALDAIGRDLAEQAPLFAGVRVWRGVEVDADPFALDGSSMLADFSGLEVVFGSTHVFPGGEAFWFEAVELLPHKRWEMAQRWRKWTAAFVATGRLNVLAHPGDLLGARELVPPFDDPETLGFFEPLLETMARHGVAFELNELLGSKLSEAYRESYPALVGLARTKGVRFAVSSDAHKLRGIGRFAWVRRVMAEAGVTEDELWEPPAKDQ